jgi:hypothetical protein
MPKSTITEICQYLHYNIDAIDTLPLSIAALCGSINRVQTTNLGYVYITVGNSCNKQLENSFASCQTVQTTMAA